MNIILCNSCGYVFSRIGRACPSCTRDEFTFYKDPRDPDLLARQKKLTGNGMAQNELPGMLVIAAAAVVVGVLGMTWGTMAGVKPDQTKIAQPENVVRSVAASSVKVTN
jgi:hypothetical protein